jgi:hypothetical protein
MVKIRLYKIQGVWVLQISYFKKMYVAVALSSYKICYVGDSAHWRMKNGHRGVCICNQCFVCFN